MIPRKLPNIIGVVLIVTFGLTLMIPSVSAKGDFSIDAKINLQKLNDVGKLKVVVSANGDTQVKNVTGNDLKSKSTTASFRFNQKNDIVTAGGRDEYFVCAYALNAETNKMKSYACVEGNMEQPNGKNTVSIGSESRNTLSTGSFQTVNGKEVKDVTLRIGIPLSDRKEDV
jgi:hypothetical protein